MEVMLIFSEDAHVLEGIGTIGRAVKKFKASHAGNRNRIRLTGTFSPPAEPNGLYVMLQRKTQSVPVLPNDMIMEPAA